MVILFIFGTVIRYYAHSCKIALCHSDLNLSNYGHFFIFCVFVVIE